MARYFKDDEFKCPCCGQNHISTELVEMLDKARFLAGVPFIITSGYRCSEHNQAVNGKSRSAHLAGKAVDISCKDSRTRLIMIDALLRTGFNRIGIGKNFVHADINPVADKNVMWLY